MNCGDFESKLADHIDGTLGEAERAALEMHAAACPVCREFMAEAAGAAAFLKRASELEPPAELITRIAYQAPLGRTRAPFERQSLFSSLTSKWLSPILQPRLVMGMAMTVLSFAMLGRCTGVNPQHLQSADLNPVHVWGGMEEKAVRLKDRLVKNYENLRVVYEIETRLKDLQQQDAAQTPSTQNQGAKK
jgi:anti-sigma factor RsiW